MADVVAAPNLRQCLACFSPRKCVLDLWAVSFGFLPNLTPLALALALPSPVLDLINSLSNSAMLLRMSIAGLSRQNENGPS
jgi:hypothetical protein